MSKLTLGENTFIVAAPYHRFIDTVLPLFKRSPSPPQKSLNSLNLHTERTHIFTQLGFWVKYNFRSKSQSLKACLTFPVYSIKRFSIVKIFLPNLKFTQNTNLNISHTVGRLNQTCTEPYMVLCGVLTNVVDYIFYGVSW